jgi:hypothetical protein
LKKNGTEDAPVVEQTLLGLENESGFENWEKAL